MASPLTFLVFGATGGTGKHFVAQALREGHKVRALVRSPSKLTITSSSNFEIWQGSFTDPSIDLDGLVKGTQYVVAMIGDRVAQRDKNICTEFVQRLVPYMRKHGVKRFLFQAGGLTRPHNGSLSPLLWSLRYTIARSFDGQHRDNEAVHEYFVEHANDIEWIVHRAGIGGDGESKGKLQRSNTKFSIGNFRDCADYNLRTVLDDEAVRTIDFSHYGSG